MERDYVKYHQKAEIAKIGHIWVGGCILPIPQNVRTRKGSRVLVVFTMRVGGGNWDFLFAKTKIKTITTVAATTTTTAY